MVYSIRKVSFYHLFNKWFLHNVTDEVNTMYTISCLPVNEPVLHISSGKFHTKAHWKHKYMYHDGNFEVIIIIKGVLHLKIDDELYDIHENEIFTLPPYHHLEGYKESPADTEYFWFHFFVKAPQFETIELEDHTSCLSQNVFKTDQIVLPIQFKVDDMAQIFVLANEILDVSQSNYFTPMSTDYILTTLLIELSEQFYKQIQDTSTSFKAERVEEIKNWIKANLTGSLKVSDVANSFNLNTHYLVRIFKNETDLTVIQYINQLKLKRAQELLLRTKLSIKQIASLSYYSDDKRFMKSFKQNTSLTPSEYRQAYAKKFLDSSNFDPEIPITHNLDSYRKKFNDLQRGD